MNDIIIYAEFIILAIVVISMVVYKVFFDTWECTDADLHEPDETFTGSVHPIRESQNR